MNTLSNAPFRELSTDRLTLRKLALRDAQGVFALRNNAEASELIGRPLWDSLGQSKEYIESRVRDIDDGDCLYWSIDLKGDSKNGSVFIGTICLWNFVIEQDRAEIGYELLPEFHGQGYASEALQAVMEYGFGDLGLTRIEAVYFNLENLKSISLLERNGFTYEGEHVVEDKPAFIYAIEVPHESL